MNSKHQAVSKAFSDGLCVECGEEALPRCHTVAGCREFLVTGMCKECFDELFGERH